MKIMGYSQKGHKLRRLGLVAAALFFVTAPRTCLAGSGGRVTLGFELGMDRSTRAHKPTESHEKHGWAWGPEAALVESYRIGDTWGVDGSARICTRGEAIDLEWYGVQVRAVIETRVAAMRCVFWKAIPIGAWDPRIGLGGQVDYALRSWAKVTSATASGSWRQDAALADLDLAPVISVGVRRRLSGVVLGVEAAYMYGLCNTNDGLNRGSLRIFNRSVGLVIRVTR